MIICPNCKEEIDDDSHYCDQCGQELFYCEKCGRVGMGRRCTSCGGLMLSSEEYAKRARGHTAVSTSISSGFVSQDFVTSHRGDHTNPGMRQSGTPQGIPQLMLNNSSLNIRIVGINGAVIGRRQGPYAQFFQNNMYVSGVHAQLRYNYNTGWCVADKHSSNGTKLNEHTMQPDVEMSLKNGDILTIANINLQVVISNK